MAKPGRIGRYQLLRPWQFETMGIARPHELPKRQRVGALAVKVGMTQEWNEHGARVPLTVLWIDECEVRARPGDRRPATMVPRRRLPRDRSIAPAAVTLIAFIHLLPRPPTTLA